MWLHEGHIQAIKNFPQLAFTAQWVLFDFAVSKRNEGYITCLDGENTGADDETNRRLNDKCLVKRDHITKKDTFYLYKAWWNPTSKFVHICQQNYIKNVDRVIKCYTNDPDNGELSLYVNGTFIETATVTNDIATFTAMDFDLGDVVRVDGANTSDTFTFTTIATELSSESDE
jgi:beta-galactosidase